MQSTKSWVVRYFQKHETVKALFSLSRFSSPVHSGLTNRGKPGRAVANRGRTVAASSISQGFALCNSRQNYEGPFYVLGWNKILVKLLSEYVSQPL